VSTPAVLVPLLVAFAVVMAVTAWQIHQHRGNARHRLHHPGLRNSRLRHLIAPRKYR